MFEYGKRTCRRKLETKALCRYLVSVKNHGVIAEYIYIYVYIYICIYINLYIHTMLNFFTNQIL